MPVTMDAGGGGGSVASDWLAQTVGGSVTTPASLYSPQVTAIQRNPETALVPQPGTVPVSPNSPWWTGVVSILKQGTDSYTQLELEKLRAKAAARNGQMYVPQHVVDQAQRPKAEYSWAWILGGVAVLGLGAYWLMKKR